MKQNKKKIENRKQKIENRKQKIENKIKNKKEESGNGVQILDEVMIIRFKVFIFLLAKKRKKINV